MPMLTMIMMMMTMTNMCTPSPVPEMCRAFKSYKTIDDNLFHDNDDDDDNATMTTLMMI